MKKNIALYLLAPIALFLLMISVNIMAADDSLLLSIGYFFLGGAWTTSLKFIKDEL